MTIEITNNPHSFIVFLTASMGISYAFFRHSGFGLGKLLALVFVGGSLAITAIEHGHIIDIGLGTFIGFLHAKDMVCAMNPIPWFTGVLDRFQWGVLKSHQSRQSNHHEQARTQQQSSESHDDFREQEAKKRQQQAQQEREKAKRKKSNSKQQQQNKHNSSRSNNSNQSQQKRSSSSSQHKAQPKTKTQLEMDCELMGITPSMTRDEAKKLYRKLISRYHQDKLAGLPEKEIKEAEEKAKKINTAWDRIRKLKKWR